MDEKAYETEIVDIARSVYTETPFGIAKDDMFLTQSYSGWQMLKAYFERTYQNNNTTRS